MAPSKHCDSGRMTGNPELIGRDSQFLYFAESPIAWINREPNPRIASCGKRLNSKVDRQKIAPDDCATRHFAPQKQKRRAPCDARRDTPLTKLYSNFWVINGNCSLALASD